VKLSETQISWFRLRRSGLVKPFASPDATASALAGVQAQILPAAALAIWNRTRGLTYSKLDNLLYEKRSLVKLWGQRGTLHLYTSREWPLICGALAGQRIWWERQGEQNSGSREAYAATVARVAELLRQRGTMGRSDLRAAGLDLDDTDFSSWGGIFAALVQRGYACHAGQVSNEGQFAHREYWLPDLEWNPPAYDEANVALIRRHLRVYGPATAQDVMYWRGARAGDAQRWLTALKDKVAEVNIGGQTRLALRADLDALDEKPPARQDWPVKLLYRFDPLLLGIKDKAWIVDERHYKRVFRIAGHIEGTLLERGRIAGTWRYDRKDSGLAISLFPFSPLSARVRQAVEENANGVARFFGLPLTDLTFEDHGHSSGVATD
jgi:hypothetical protein